MTTRSIAPSATVEDTEVELELKVAEHARVRGLRARAAFVGVRAVVEGVVVDHLDITGVGGIARNISASDAQVIIADGSTLDDFEAGAMVEIRVAGDALVSRIRLDGGGLVIEGGKVDETSFGHQAYLRLVNPRIERSHFGHNVTIGDNARISDSRVATMVEIGHSAAVVDSTIGADSKIGAFAEIFGSALGHHVLIGSYTSVRNVKIGDNAVIGSGNVIEDDVPAETTIPDRKVEAGETFTVQGNAETWKLARLAEIAEKTTGRLDKRALLVEHPALVNTQLVKDLLRRPKPVTARELREMARGFEKHPKYEVTTYPGMWQGVQRIGQRANDVLTFGLSFDAIEPLAAEAPFGPLDIGLWAPEERKSLQLSQDVHGILKDGTIDIARLVVEQILLQGQVTDHPGGQEQRAVGWMRFNVYWSHKSVLVEEMQTDCLILAFDPEKEAKELAEWMGTSVSAMMQVGLLPYRSWAAKSARWSTNEAVRDLILASYLGKATRNEAEVFLGDVAREAGDTVHRAFLGEPWDSAVAIAAMTSWALPMHRTHMHWPIGKPDELGFAHTLMVENRDPASLLGVAAAFLNAAYMRDEDVMDRLAFYLMSRAYKANKDDDFRERWNREVGPAAGRLRGPTGFPPFGFPPPVPLPKMPLTQRAWQDAEKIRGLAISTADWAVSCVKTLRETLGDLYESMLAAMLVYARKKTLREVWVLEYGTKYALAAYSEEVAPPRSVYHDIPKRFQVSTVEPLPGYMDVSEYARARDDIADEPWVKVKSPEKPMGRKLLPNRGAR